ncbi:MAG: hypothetical protein BWX71_02713 [Deltaproteobacteria bacterium ADurb.Bin072]|nr:MAG: hypothetical protein BWX71_02713 [Deltaproteobacteria bacterium ADurb.Bin072]
MISSGKRDLVSISGLSSAMLYASGPSVASSEFIYIRDMDRAWVTISWSFSSDALILNPISASHLRIAAMIFCQMVGVRAPFSACFAMYSSASRLCPDFRDRLNP